ncbi:MAG: extracellular solute-binding protein [Lachnospiraceae bacterium]|nr:extracellular solute-binding protein [Lachnospiraceae bacterium]
MKTMKRIMALTLSVLMMFSLAACSKGNNETQVVANGDAASSADVVANGDAANDTPGSVTKVHNNVIEIGTWWTQHYDSNDTSVEDNPDYLNAIDQEGDTEETKKINAVNRAQMEARFAHVAEVEQKYNVKYYWKNLTYSGVEESINTSILAGSPDCDIYLVDSPMAFPAQANGLAIDLRTFVPADHDIFNDQIVASFIDLGDGKACLIKRQGGMTNTYPLAFNVQMLEDNNLEDPRDLWARGEWTWAKFDEYCKILTQDTDGDGQVDQYGFSGFATDTLEQLLMSNGATIASGTTTTITDSKVAEALQQLQDMYTTYNYCYPYDIGGENAHETMRFAYKEGKSGFFPISCWFHTEGTADYDWDGSLGSDTLNFDIAYVRWPVGPSGNKDTNAAMNDTGAELYIIPAGVQEPDVVFNTLFDSWNWYDYDISKRDDPASFNWWITANGREKEYQDANFACQQDCMAHSEVDLWQSLGFYYDLDSIVDGAMTPAQWQETYKQQVQDGLDAVFGNK